ncbi:MAG TPA: hypothetical protein VM261_17110 [Kofleriaceae bacterium]|nr:hypothetical protein [Kofleriaceae bacterium]
MRRAVVIASAALVSAAAVAAPGVASADPLPAGRLSVLGSARNGTGGLADELGFGYAFGVEAGYQPMGPTQRVGWGASWSTQFSRYGSGSARVADQLKMVEMDLGLRARVVMGARRRLVLHVGGGGALLRTNEPVVVNRDRDQVGYWGSAGVEFGLWSFIFGVSMRYAPIVDGSGTIGLQLAVGRGT